MDRLEHSKRSATVTFITSAPWSLFTTLVTVPHEALGGWQGWDYRTQLVANGVEVQRGYVT